MTRPSLSVVYQGMCSAACGTDAETFEASLALAREYRIALMNYLVPKASTPEWFTRIFEYPELEPTLEHQQAWNALAAKEGHDVLFKKVWNWERIAPLDVRGVPMPTDSQPRLTERLSSVVPEMETLCGLTIGFVLLAFRRVLVYAVD
jgi:hypothetical protein